LISEFGSRSDDLSAQPLRVDAVAIATVDAQLFEQASQLPSQLFLVHSMSCVRLNWLAFIGRIARAINGRSAVPAETSGQGVPFVAPRCGVTSYGSAREWRVNRGAADALVY
jgi:hypothetical protein